MRKLECGHLRAVSNDTFGHVSLDVWHFIGSEAHAIKATKVIGVTLADMDLACMFREKIEKCLIPTHRAVVCVVVAERYVQRRQQVADVSCRPHADSRT